MKLRGHCVRLALEKHIGRALADRLDLPAEIEDADLGGPILKAFAPHAEGDGLLSQVVVSGTGTFVTLDAHGVEGHPLLVDYLGGDLASVLSRPFSSGAQYLGELAWRPDFGCFQALDLGDGVLRGMAQITWRVDRTHLFAVAHYGPVANDPPFAAYTNLAGEALFAAGREARAMMYGARELAPSGGSSARASARVLH